MDLAKLPGWYEPHVEAWSKAALPTTVLWFFNSEVGWATIHPVLVRHGWQYEQLNVWDKGAGHIAGRVNGNTLRRFPTVTEVCAMYSRPAIWEQPDGAHLTTQQWLRAEWQRSGLPLREANQACGVRNAASRKWLTADHLWYPPSTAEFEALANYANEHGRPAGRPYFVLGEQHDRAAAWECLRYRWNYQHGITNVWRCPAVSGTERFRGDGLRAGPGRHNLGAKHSTHANQKPLKLMRRIVRACTVPGDVVWEPFGGLCSAAVAAIALGRVPYAAEVIGRFADLAQQRLDAAAADTLQWRL